MARRRSTLPREIRAELPARANAGIGLDPEFPTKMGEKVYKAAIACRHQPSLDMVAFVKQIMEYLTAHDATQVRLLQHFRDRGQPGALLLVWASGPAAADVAAKFAVSTSPCGTPRLPSWLSLRVDNDFDLRWQPPF